MTHHQPANPAALPTTMRPNAEGPAGRWVIQRQRGFAGLIVPWRRPCGRTGTCGHAGAVHCHPGLTLGRLRPGRQATVPAASTTWQQRLLWARLPGALGLGATAQVRKRREVEGRAFCPRRPAARRYARHGAANCARSSACGSPVMAGRRQPTSPRTCVRRSPGSLARAPASRRQAAAARSAPPDRPQRHAR